jgi:hypothetical protein
MGDGRPKTEDGRPETGAFRPERRVAVRYRLSPRKR